VAILGLPVAAAGAASAGALGDSSPSPPPTDPPPGTTTEPTEVDWQAKYEAEHRRSVRRLRGWRRANRIVVRVRRALRASPNPVTAGLRCVHLGEGSWLDAGDPYWGGLQMDRHFMLTYGRPLVQRYGWANRWPVEAQLAVGTIAVYSGRGFGPWPVTRRPCGL
jgi:hypothetical protein